MAWYYGMQNWKAYDCDMVAYCSYMDAHAGEIPIRVTPAPNNFWRSIRMCMEAPLNLLSYVPNLLSDGLPCTPPPPAHLITVNNWKKGCCIDRHAIDLTLNSEAIHSTLFLKLKTDCQIKILVSLCSSIRDIKSLSSHFFQVMVWEIKAVLQNLSSNYLDFFLFSYLCHNWTNCRKYSVQCTTAQAKC